MSSNPFDNGSPRPSQLTSTEPFPTITPSSTATTRDEKLYPISIELKQTSSVSPPPTAHQGTPYDTDIEAMTTQQSSDRLNRQSMANADPNCSQWPGKDHWKQKARAAKMNNRSCQCFSSLSRRARIALKIAILLLIVGVAVGVGFGVSKPLGANIWQPHNG